MTTSVVAPDAAAIAAWGLPTAHALPRSPLPDEQFSTLLAKCVRERVVGLFGAAVRDDAFPATDAQRLELETSWQEWLAHALRVERLAITVCDTLAAAGIDTRVLKGLALAHTVYPDPALRVFGDVDVLVTPGRLHDAGDVLVHQMAGSRAEPELRPGFDDRFGREVLVNVEGLEVDLHRTFVNGAYGIRIDRALLFADSQTVHVAGRSVPVLTPVNRLLHAAYAASLADWPARLVALRDVAQIIAADRPAPDEALDRAHAWRGTAVLATGIARAWHALRLTDRPPLVEWARRRRPSPTDRLLLAASRGPARGYTSQLTSLLAIHGLADRLAFVRAVAWPSSEYRAARGLGRLGLLRTGARRIRRSAR